MSQTSAWNMCQYQTPSTGLGHPSFNKVPESGARCVGQYLYTAALLLERVSQFGLAVRRYARS